MKVRLTGLLYQDGDLWVAQCAEGDVASQGPTREAATAALVEALTLRLVEEVTSRWGARFATWPVRPRPLRSGRWAPGPGMFLGSGNHLRGGDRTAQVEARRRARVYACRTAWWTSEDGTLRRVHAEKVGRRYEYTEVAVELVDLELDVEAKT